MKEDKKPTQDMGDGLPKTGGDKNEQPAGLTINHYSDGTASVLRKPVVYTELRFYQRSDVLYQLTQVFCQRYMKTHGDRTVDQMVQAARSTKQNITEGSSDGQVSMEVELKLLGIARGSNLELLEDYKDYLKKKGLVEWYQNNPRFEKLHRFCTENSTYEAYRPILVRMDDEELANMAICLCHQVDRALESYIQKKDREFTTEGGIRERMTAARLEQRASQKQIIESQQKEITSLQREIDVLRNEMGILRSEINVLRSQNETLKHENETLKHEII